MINKSNAATDWRYNFDDVDASFSDYNNISCTDSCFRSTGYMGTYALNCNYSLSCTNFLYSGTYDLFYYSERLDFYVKITGIAAAGGITMDFQDDSSNVFFSINWVKTNTFINGVYAFPTSTFANGAYMTIFFDPVRQQAKVKVNNLDDTVWYSFAHNSSNFYYINTTLTEGSIVLDQLYYERSDIEINKDLNNFNYQLELILFCILAFILILILISNLI